MALDSLTALIAQLGERKTEDLEALCSIHSQSISFVVSLLHYLRPDRVLLLFLVSRPNLMMR